MKSELRYFQKEYIRLASDMGTMAIYAIIEKKDRVIDRESKVTNQENKKND